ncbi:hypothetical protein CEP54_011770 [Fusarium duplospermum]|uniref:Uncharacterized protein n=1 Tax=Fusarium duplospermum TaxID=1325734 RepID=A0A428PCD7_9HYPO|nr:hypothetical protein CEP54_011770 [Fusarium duplospermum]
MPGNNSVPVKTLSSLFKGGIREQMFDLAHDVLDSLEPRIIRLRDLEAFVRKSHKIKRSPMFQVEGAADCMERFQNVEQLFDSLVGRIGRDVEADISRLEVYIVEALGELPDEIPSGKLQTPYYGMYHELVDLYGSSELPSLVTSFESKSKDEVFEQAEGVLRTLQHLLDRAKSLALECIPCRESCFTKSGLDQLLDHTNHMFLLQEYIDRDPYRSQAITKFMAGKFDRSATRLDCLLRAYILCYEDLPKKGTPIEFDIPSLRAAYKGVSLVRMCAQNKEDHTALKSLSDEYQDVVGRTKDGVVAATFFGDRADLRVIWKHQIMARNLRKRTFGRYFDFLGTDFIEIAYAILHGLIRADIKTLEGLISDVKMIKSHWA